MRYGTRTWDPIATVDSPAQFRLYLQRECTDRELVSWVMKQLEGRDALLTETVRGVLGEAVGYLGRAELIEQIVLNEPERRSCPGYRRWCLEVLEARKEQRMKEGAVY